MRQSRAAGSSSSRRSSASTAIKSVADGFAKDGYVAIAPAMFDRVQKNFDVGYAADIEKGARCAPRSRSTWR